MYKRQPIANALERKGLLCHVADDSTIIDHPAGSSEFAHDKKVSAWIARFDINRKIVQPFNLILDSENKQVIFKEMSQTRQNSSR